MGNSTNLIALKKGIVNKWKYFFISSSLINYYLDFSIFFQISFNYLFFLVRFKYYLYFRQNGIFFSHIICNKSQNNQYYYKIFIKDFYFINFYFLFLKFYLYPIKFLQKGKNLKIFSIQINIFNKLFIFSKKYKKLYFLKKKIKSLLYFKTFMYNYFIKKFLYIKYKGYNFLKNEKIIKNKLFVFNFKLYLKIKILKQIIYYIGKNFNKFIFYISYIFINLKFKLISFKINSLNFPSINLFQLRKYLIIYLYSACFNIIKYNNNLKIFLKKIFKFFYYIIFNWYVFKFIENYIYRIKNIFYKNYNLFIKNKLLNLLYYKNINLKNLKKYGIIYTSKVKVEFNLLSSLVITTELFLYYLKWKLDRQFMLDLLIWNFFKKYKFKNYFINGFFIKGKGRFTRRQRASLYRFSKGKKAFKSYNTNLNINLINIITRYGQCTLKLIFNYRNRYNLYQNIKFFKF